MTLRQQQSLFAQLVGRLITWSYENGFELTLGETVRTKEQAYANEVQGIGTKDSLHIVRLAIDLNLFIDGKYQVAAAAYAPLGLCWKTLHPLCRWGGDWSKRDANHFSLEYQGRQ